MRMDSAGAEPISGQAHRGLLGAGPRASTPQPLADPRPLVRPAHNTAYGEEGRLRVEREAGAFGIWAGGRDARTEPAGYDRKKPRQGLGMQGQPD